MVSKLRMGGTEVIDSCGEYVTSHVFNQALMDTSKCHQAEIREFHVSPIYTEEFNRHQWLVEFSRNPNNLNQFADDLEENLKRISPDYRRYLHKEMLKHLELKLLSEGTFATWLNENKPNLCAQTKVPRAQNHRKMSDSLLEILKTTCCLAVCSAISLKRACRPKRRFPRP